MITARTSSVDETRDLAAALSELSRPGDILLLAGDLGAGKTAFAQGFGRGLGVTEPITSPTFTLARQYDGRLALHHIDVYRLDHMSELFDVGLPELLDEGAVTLVEWGDVILPAVGTDFLEVRMSFGSGDDDRLLRLRAVGSTWVNRSRALTTAVGPWATRPAAAAAGDEPC